MPPILQRRQEHLSIKLLAARGKKNVPKLVKYIFPSSKEWTEVWWLKYQDCLPFSRMNVDNMDLAVNLYNHYQIFYTTYKEDLQKCYW